MGTTSAQYSRFRPYKDTQYGPCTTCLYKSLRRSVCHNEIYDEYHVAGVATLVSTCTLTAPALQPGSSTSKGCEMFASVESVDVRFRESAAGAGSVGFSPLRRVLTDFIRYWFGSLRFFRYYTSFFTHFAIATKSTPGRDASPDAEPSVARSDSPLLTILVPAPPKISRPPWRPLLTKSLLPLAAAGSGNGDFFNGTAS